MSAELHRMQMEIGSYQLLLAIKRELTGEHPAPKPVRPVLSEGERRQIGHMAYRLRVLPSQLQTARRRLADLEREAARLGLHHLLSNKEGIR